MNLPDYLPAPAELTAEEILAARATLTAWLAAAQPELDTAPNTPFGDLFLTPAARMAAAENVAAKRLLGDHNLQNIAAGGAFNCDNATAFVNNFHPSQSENLYSRGYVRLVFSTDAHREIDSGTALRFPVTNGVTAALSSDVFYFLLYDTGALTIRASGSARRENENCYILKQLGDEEYSVDVPVYGVASSAVPAGTAAEFDQAIAGLVRGSAIGVFIAAGEAQTLKTLASRASVQIYASSLNNRFGGMAFLQREFPDLVDMGITLGGDVEMRRDSVNAIGVREAAMDVWVRGSNVGVLETTVVRLTYHSLQSDASLRKFIGRLDLPAFPVLIEDIAVEGDDEIDLGFRDGLIQILSRTSNTRIPRLAAAHSLLEDLWIGIPMPVDAAGADAIAMDVDTETGAQSALFRITYRADDAVPAVHACLTADDVQPANVRVLVRGFLPVFIRSITVKYRRDAGAYFNLAQARAEVVAYFNGLRYPDTVSEGKLADIVSYAGGRYAGNVCDARLLWSVASHVRDDADLDPDEDWAGIIADAYQVPQVGALEVRQMEFHVTDSAAGTVNALYHAATPRNLTYFVDADNVHFEAV